MPLHSNSSYPKISVVTPSLNQGHFIEETIHSVLSQGYPNLEYIVMDGGSTDTTVDILRSYSDRLLWFSEKDKGQTNAINKGLSKASGDILAYLNTDDLFLPGTLEKIARTFMDNPNAMWVTGKCRIIDERGKEVRRLITAYKNLYLRLHQHSFLVITDYISQPATFWRAEIYKTLGPFDDELHYTMDYDYWLRLSAKFPLLYIPEYLAAFRVHEQSKNTNVGHKDVYIEEERAVISRHTRSRSLLALHDLHRWLMTTIYSIMNG